MATDYGKQYKPEQLEPFWPNEIVKMTVAVLCTLAVIMFFAILPALLDSMGIHGAAHHEEPANPRGSTPAGIKPEWYFLAVYQYLRLMPTKLLGISGKTLGVLSQGIGIGALVLLPFWYRKRAARRPGWAYRIAVTVVVGAFVVLTVWGGWEEQIVGGEERLVPLSVYLGKHALTFILIGAAIGVFYALIAQERRGIRRVLYDETQEQRGEEGRS
jgi:quinol-cytochrome oxidoreductase complex cytochrome b subunit